MTTDPTITFFTALFFDPHAIEQAASLVHPEDFPQDEHRHTYSVMLELAQGGKPIDVAHVFDKLLERGYSETRTSELLARLMDGQPAVYNIRHYAELMRKSSRKRRLMHVAETVLARAEGNTDPDEIVRELQEELWAMQSDRHEGGLVYARDFVPEFLKQAAVERERSGELIGMSTGIPKLDDLTTGLRPGEFWVVGALPGRGKTAFGTQVAVEAIGRGVPVAVFSHELSRNDLSRRIFARKFGIWSMRELRNVSEKTWAKINQYGTDDVATLPLSVDDAASLTASELSARARAAVRERGVKLIMVDYLQLLRGPEREIRERVGNAANILRQLAKDTQVPVLALSQLKRPANLNDKPTMIDLKESGDIEAHAHCVLLLYQRIENAKPNGEDEVIIGKQRNGPLGIVPVLFDPSTLLFKPRDAEAESDAA